MTRALMFIDVQRNMLEPPTPVPTATSIRQALQDLHNVPFDDIDGSRIVFR